jgi:hypothetical protein
MRSFAIVMSHPLDELRCRCRSLIGIILSDTLDALSRRAAAFATLALLSDDVR